MSETDPLHVPNTMTGNGGVRYRAAEKQHEAGVGDYQLEPAAVFGLAPHLVIPRGRLLGTFAVPTTNTSAVQTAAHCRAQAQKRYPECYPK